MMVRIVFVRQVLPLLLCFCGTGCVYRLTNLHAPRHKIAVEAIYNTQARYLPHERLWQAVQAMLARNGRLAARSDATQLLRIQVRDSEVSPDAAQAELRLTVVVELWGIRPKKLLFTTTYRLDSTYQTVFEESQVPRPLWLVRTEEARTTAMTRIGTELARRLQRDMFVPFDW